jgi:transcriptional regulator with XRE-family HTH domain
MIEVSQQIINAREMRNISLRELSLQTGLSEEFLFDIESGVVDPNASVLLVISNTLNCNFTLGSVSI